MLVEGHPRNLPVKLFQNRCTGKGGEVVKSFFSIFSSGGHLVQQSGTVLAVLVDTHLRNIPVKLFQNLSIDIAEEVVKSLSLFIALAAILFNVAELFEQFW